MMFLLLVLLASLEFLQYENLPNVQKMILFTRLKEIARYLTKINYLGHLTDYYHFYWF